MNCNNINPVLSVIIPVYNTEEYLEKCLSSLVASTFKNLEFIIIDDGSTDNSPEICDKFKTDNPDWMIKVIHKHNEGLSAVRNLGLSIAVGKYVTFCDSDDWIEPELFASLVTAAEQHNAQAAICGIRYFDEITKSFQYHTDSLFPKHLAGNVFNFYTCNSIMQGLLDCSTCNKIFLRSFIEKHNYQYDVSCHFAEDSMFWAEYFISAERLFLIKGEYYNYRINQNRQTNCVKAKKSYTSFAESMVVISKIFKSHQILDKYRGELIAYLALQIGIAYCNIMPDRKKSFYYECKKVFEACKKFSFSSECTLAVKICSMYTYIIFRYCPFIFGTIALTPIKVLQNNKIKELLRKLAGK